MDIVIFSINIRHFFRHSTYIIAQVSEVKKKHVGNVCGGKKRGKNPYMWGQQSCSLRLLLLLWRLGGNFCLLDIITALKLHLWEWNEEGKHKHKHHSRRCQSARRALFVTERIQGKCAAWLRTAATCVKCQICAVNHSSYASEAWWDSRNLKLF